MYGSDGPVDDSRGPGGGSGGPGRFETLISYEAFSSKGSGGVAASPGDSSAMTVCFVSRVQFFVSQVLELGIQDFSTSMAF